MGLFTNDAANRALVSMRQQEKNLNRMLQNRQAIIDPYAGVKDLSSMVSNPFASLQVATKAAEIQGQEADISLASTLDTLRATGGAGSATALAQAALRSKQGISATIAQQEAQNAQLRAQGEQQTQQIRMQEATRLQDAQVMGQAFKFQTQEQRDVADISRTSAMQQQYAQQYQDAKARQSQLIGSIIGGVGMMLAPGFGVGGIFNKG
jgi:hypothetical protein